MDWHAQVDGYCERIGTAFWAEPVNAVTNLAFILAGLVMWGRARGVPVARVLAAVLMLIGIGSGLFHTLATRWAGLADVLPILGYILIYVYAANRHVLGWSPGWSVAGAAAVIPWTAALAPVFGLIPVIGVSAGYWPIPALILLYAAVLARSRPALARDFAGGAAVLVLSLVFRSLDEPLCDVAPMGTHFLWHILNAVMLGWMIEVLLRHRVDRRLAGRGRGR